MTTFSPYKKKRIINSVKSLIRFFYYHQERRKIFKNIKIRKQQNNAIRNFELTSIKLIVFIVPGLSWNTGKEQISGGTMSIISICQESIKLREIHGAEVIACTHTQASLLIKHTNFDNQIPIFRLEQVTAFKAAKEIMIHLPEFMVNDFGGMLSRSEMDWLSKRQVHYNILNQSIQLMPPPAKIRTFLSDRSNVTITTAHTQYCTSEFQLIYGVPLHKLSTWVSPEKYIFKDYKDKNSLIVVSPDPHPKKEIILEKLRAIPGLSVKIIQNLRYEEYKELISKAKWSITFGEGLDGYFVEAIFSGAIGFGLFNDDFFTADFGEITTLYKSEDLLLDGLIEDIKTLDVEPLFQAHQKKQFDLCANHYSEIEYKRNIASFYREEYTYA